MGNNPFSYSDEVGFEQNAAIARPKKAISDAAKGAVQGASQQVKAAAADAANQFLDALYGSSVSPSDQTDATKQQPQQQGEGASSSLQNIRQQLSQQQSGQGGQKQGGVQQPQSPEAQTKQTEAQQSMDMHKKTYDIEYGMAKARREREEVEQQRKQAEAEEAERIAEEKQGQEQQFIAPTGKTTGAPGRNRKGQRPLAVQQAQNKGETGRNVVAG